MCVTSVVVEPSAAVVVVDVISVAVPSASVVVSVVVSVVGVVSSDDSVVVVVLSSDASVVVSDSWRRRSVGEISLPRSAPNTIRKIVASPQKKTKQHSQRIAWINLL